jgi:hypothetical protein
LWRCGDGLFFEVPPLASDALLTTLLFVVGKAQKLHGARSELNSMFGLEKVDWWDPIRTSACSTVLLKLTANGVQHVFERWVEKETVTAPPQNSDSE